MAIRPEAEYPGQTIPASAGYPGGSARNITVAGDGTGTPLERRWVNDLWGFLQSLLDAAGITASGVPDEVGASDYFDALNALYPAIARMVAAEASIVTLTTNLGLLAGELITEAATRLAADILRVVGPASATANALARYDSTTGKLIKDSTAILSDAGALSGLTDVTISGEVKHSTAQTVWRWINLGAARVDEINGAGYRSWKYDGATWLTDKALVSNNDCRLHLPIDAYINTGEKIVGISVEWNPGNGRASIARVNGNLIDPAGTLLETWYDAGAGLATITPTFTAGGHTVDRDSAGVGYRIYFQSGTSDANEDQITKVGLQIERTAIHEL